MTTPHSVAAPLVEAPLLNSVLFSSLPTSEELSTLLSAEFGTGLHKLEQGYEFEDVHLAVRGIAAKPSAQAEYSFHPVLSGNPHDLNDVGAHILIGVVEGGDIFDKAQQFREPRLHQIRLLLRATTALLRASQARAVHLMNANTTVFPEPFFEAISRDVLSMSAATVWVFPDKDGLHAFTYGLTSAGHPELEIADTHADPTELYYRLVNIADHVLQGASFKDGDTLAFSENEKPASISETGWFVNAEIPALNISWA